MIGSSGAYMLMHYALRGHWPVLITGWEFAPLSSDPRACGYTVSSYNRGGVGCMHILYDGDGVSVCFSGYKTGASQTTYMTDLCSHTNHFGFVRVSVIMCVCIYERETHMVYVLL